MQAKYRKDYRSPDFTVSTIDLAVDLNPSCTQVKSTLKIKRLRHDARTLRLDGRHLKLIDFTLDGNDYPIQLDDEGLTLDVDKEHFTLNITTEIYPDKNTSLQGLYQSGDGICTQCEAEGFRQITYMIDRPDVLAKYTTTITADKKRYPFLLSNGNRIESGDLEHGKHFVKWHDPFPKPCYLFALVAGDFDLLTDSFTTASHRHVALEIYVDKGNRDKSHWAMQCLKKAMAWDEKRFGLEYDLDIYMIVAVDFFNMGAMENKGLNIFNSHYILANPTTATDSNFIAVEAVIGHEYFHNWTGNRITCCDWFQLSLKEGLTVFREQEFTSDHYSRPVKRIEDVSLLRTQQFAEDEGPMAHPVRPEKVIEMNNFYTLTVYEKGAEVIRMIHTLLGEEKFQAGMRLYIKENDGSAASCEKFVSAMERASGIDLGHFRLWYSQSGTPTVKAQGEFTGTSYRLTLEQTTPPTLDQAEKSALHIPVKMALYRPDGSKIALSKDGQAVSNLLNFTKDKQTFEFDADQRPIPALFEDFSAPVKCEYDYTAQELATLAACADNEFIRFDAFTRLFEREFKAGVTAINHKQAVQLSDIFVQSFKALLNRSDEDQMFAALALQTPSLTELFEKYRPVPVDALVQARHEIRTLIRNIFADKMYEIYTANHHDNQEITPLAMNQRAIKNLMLSYLGDDALTLAQFEQATNMTDYSAAMNAAVANDLPHKEHILKAFEHRFADDALVLDKWFNAMASQKNALPVVRSLLNHPQFNLKNPNRARALIGAFANNLAEFHNIDGSGYAFLGEHIAKLNDINPQVASRLIEPLIKFAKFDQKRQDLMKAELAKLQRIPTLSKDLFEKIEKALA